MCCCPDRGAHLLEAQVRRGLVTTVADAADVETTAGTYRALSTSARPDIAPMQVLSLALQRALGDVELEAAELARVGIGDAPVMAEISWSSTARCAGGPTCRAPSGS